MKRGVGGTAVHTNLVISAFSGPDSLIPVYLSQTQVLIIISGDGRSWYASNPFFSTSGTVDFYSLFSLPSSHPSLEALRYVSFPLSYSPLLTLSQKPMGTLCEERFW